MCLTLIFEDGHGSKPNNPLSATVMAWSQVLNDETRLARVHTGAETRQMKSRKRNMGGMQEVATWTTHPLRRVWFYIMLSLQMKTRGASPPPSPPNDNLPAKQARPANDDAPNEDTKNIGQTEPGNGNTRRKTAGTPHEQRTRFGGCVVILRFSSEPTTPTNPNQDPRPR
ncbi:hypothetical protein BS47DRAFT_1362075 [Hydnum rufescens UP504]|uniref:Uncharacterized protein n=1 Tax=Hydnum rufescens UP504 TaxID=1448309 RepID=A0A9P6AY30_9AGAM|nr:hypothetical protein BS47DRAFT_1362075 [Hydnum rufescens UP504]